MSEGNIDLLEGLGVTLAWAWTMRYAAIWLPEDCIMVLDASLDRRDLDDAIDELLPDVRRHALPSRVPRSWSAA